MIHPTDEQLNSDLVPRWAVCGWLISTCTNDIDCANLKLALFYDWLLYDPKMDNIMLIEPALLLMYKSMGIKSKPDGAAGTKTNVDFMCRLFVDFLCRISTNYYWHLRKQIPIGIMHSFKDGVEKQVIPSLQVFLDCQLELKQTPFGDFFKTLNVNQSNLVTASTSALLTPTILDSFQQKRKSIAFL